MFIYIAPPYQTHCLTVLTYKSNSYVIIVCMPLLLHLYDRTVKILSNPMFATCSEETHHFGKADGQDSGA